MYAGRKLSIECVTAHTATNPANFRSLLSALPVVSLRMLHVSDTEPGNGNRLAVFVEIASGPVRDNFRPLFAAFPGIERPEIDHFSVDASVSLTRCLVMKI